MVCHIQLSQVIVFILYMIERNQKIVLSVQHVTLDIGPFIKEGEVKVHVYKPIKESYASKHYNAREKQQIC